MGSKKEKRNHWKHQRFARIFIKKESLEGVTTPPPPRLCPHRAETPVSGLTGISSRPSVPASVAVEQVGVPVVVGVPAGRMVLPVSAAVGVGGRNCLSVHLQVHQFVAGAGSVCGVAAAAVRAHQSEDQGKQTNA